MLRLITLAALAALTAELHASSPPAQWGQAVCTAVSQSEALAFAQQNPFIYGDDNSHPPPPSGTLACTVPLKITPITFQDGSSHFALEVDFNGAPKPAGDCTVTYYDGRPTRHFTPDGSGDGMADGDRSNLSVDVSFSDLNSGARLDDNFVADSMTDSAAITWSPEYRDDNVPLPILTKCQVVW